MPLNWSQVCATDHSVYLGNASHTFPVWSIPHASSDLSSRTELRPFLKKVLLEGSCLETVVWTFVDAAAPGMKEEPALRSGRIKLWEKNQWMAEGKRGWRSREKFQGKGRKHNERPNSPQEVSLMPVRLAHADLCGAVSDALKFKSKSFYWCIFDLPCCVSFRCTAKWFTFIYIYKIHIYTSVYIHIYIMFLSRFFCIRGYYKILNIVHCATQ